MSINGRNFPLKCTLGRYSSFRIFGFWIGIYVQPFQELELLVSEEMAYETVIPTIKGKKPNFKLNYSSDDDIFSSADVTKFGKRIRFSGFAAGKEYRNTSDEFSPDFALSNGKKNGDQYAVTLTVNLELSEVEKLF